MSKVDFLHSETCKNTFESSDLYHLNRRESIDITAQNAAGSSSINKALSYAKKKAEHIISVVKKVENNDGKYNSESAALQALEDLELARKTVRDILPAIREPASKSVPKTQTLASINIEKTSKCPLRITMFPLCAYPIKGAYNVYFEVKEALEKALFDRKIDYLSDKERYVLVYDRIVPGKLALARGRCDNDNFEMGRVTNAITETLGVADSIDKFSFYFTTHSGEEAKTIVSLIPESAFLP